MTEIPRDADTPTSTPDTPPTAPRDGAYEPSTVEQKWYAYWEAGGFLPR